jgi:Outer membrane protein beta-barrel domain
MKKSLIVLFLLVFSHYNTIAQQQRFRAGLKAGMSTTQVEGDTYTGFNKLGFAGGAFVNAKLNEKWSAQFELLYIQKGSKHMGDIKVSDFSYYTMKLNYMEVPVLLKYHQKKFSYEAGPAFGYLISAKESNYYGSITSAVPFKTTEISFGIGMNYSFSNNWGINCRYSNSLFSIRTFNPGASIWYGQRNNVIALTLTRMFGVGQ